MSTLTKAQANYAIYHGGEQLRKAKAAIKRTATHLTAVHEDIRREALGPVTPAEAAIVQAAADVMRKLAELAARAAIEADRIKSNIDSRRATAAVALAVVPLTTIADQVALIALGTHTYDIARLPNNCRLYKNATPELQSALDTARLNIAWDAARSTIKPSDYVAEQITKLPALHQTHAELIKQIEQIVADQTRSREKAVA